MKVNGAPTGTGPWTVNVSRAQNTTSAATHTNGTTVFKTVADTTIETNNGSATPSVVVGDTLLIGSEQLVVSVVTATSTTGVRDLTVTRGANATTKATHLAGVSVSQQLLSPCGVPSAAQMPSQPNRT